MKNGASLFNQAKILPTDFLPPLYNLFTIDFPFPFHDTISHTKSSIRKDRNASANTQRGSVERDRSVMITKSRSVFSARCKNGTGLPAFMGNRFIPHDIVPFCVRTMPAN